ncbi:MAG: ABC transporter ATP-binding protein [Rhizobiaceae bacterium]|nr:MAG: ABC transporter ATP-binding protein [Rhizobiaceae bacterium]
MSGLELRHVRKAFGAHEVFPDLSLEVEHGEHVAIFGPSGCGKTLLLRLIAGIYDPDAGDILMDGRSILDLAPDRRGIGMAFQNFALYPHMSAFDNIASPLSAHGNSAPTEHVREIAGLLKIDHVLSHAPRALSNGQKQRTALARALVGEPKLLLLDDPLRNVDAKLRYEMRLELPKLLRGFDATVLYVTQDYKEAMALGHRIAVMSRGTIRQFGTPEEIYYQPADVEIARLFGDPTINLLQLQPEKSERGVHIRLSEVAVPLPDGDALPTGRECTVGLRPEVLAFVDADVPAAIPVTVEAETPLNEKVVSLVRTSCGHELLVSRPAGTPAPASGPAHIGVDPGRLLLFDPSSGDRIALQDAVSTRGGSTT